MSDKKVDLPVVETEDIVLKAQRFFQDYGRQIIIGLGAIVVVVGGFYSYKEFVTKPKEEKAAELIYKAQQYFSLDSSKLVLDGDGT